MAIATLLHENAADFVRSSVNAGDVNRVEFISGELTKIAHLIEDPGLQMLIRQKGQSADPRLLGPRHPGELPRDASSVVSGPARRFDGNYSGRWLDAKGTDLAGKLILNRKGDHVTGTFSFGVGQLRLDGDVIDGALQYSWRWGTDYFGRGVINANESGDELTGTWGYTKRDSQAGTWELRRE